MYFTKLMSASLHIETHGLSFARSFALPLDLGFRQPSSSPAPLPANSLVMTTPYTSPNSLHVKTESSPSPDLIPPVFPPSTSRQNAYLPVNNAATTPGAPVFRFGLDAQNDQYASMQWQSADINAPDMSLTSMSYMDEFDDGSDLVEMSSAAAGSSNDAATMSEKQIRRRSSKGA